MNASKFYFLRSLLWGAGFGPAGFGLDLGRLFAGDSVIGCDLLLGPFYWTPVRFGLKALASIGGMPHSLF